MVCARWVSSRFWSSYLANLKPPRAKKSLRRPHSSPRWRKKFKNTPLESWDWELFIYGSKKRWCVHPWWTIFEIYFSCVIRVWRYMSLIWNAEIFDKILPSEHVFYVSWWNSNTQKGMHASLQSCIQCTPKSLWYPLVRRVWFQAQYQRHSMLGNGSGRSNDLPGPRICAPAPGCEKRKQRKLQHDSETAQPASAK